MDRVIAELGYTVKGESLETGQIASAVGHAEGTSSATAVGEAVPVEALAERTATLTVEKLLAGGIVTIRSTPQGDEARV